MNQLNTRAIVLARTNYGEADRILTLLTPESGKLRVMARGVRKMKSKLAGGIELFSVSDVTYINGRGAIGTLVSTRLVKHYGIIVTSIERVQLGYELLQLLNKATEDAPEPEYFQLLEYVFQALNEPLIDLQLVSAWFEAQLLRQAGHSPNLHTDTAGKKLSPEASYMFDFETMGFAAKQDAPYNAGHIKTLRLLFSHHQPSVLSNVQGISEALETVRPVIRTMRTSFIRV